MIPGSDMAWFIGGTLAGVIAFSIWVWYRYRDTWRELG